MNSRKTVTNHVANDRPEDGASKSEARMHRTARISPCGRYRYSLSRTWNRSLPVVLFVGLNPSTADDQIDDPTVRRCIGFAKSWGYGGLILVNLFAHRATNPSELTDAADPIGPENDYWITAEQARADRIVAAWGNHGSLFDRDKTVIDNLAGAYCLGTTKLGCPRHPLYLASRTPLQKMRVSRSRPRAA